MQQRKHLRTPIRLPVRVHAGGKALRAVTEDISPGGAFLRCDLAPGIPRLVASIELPNGRDLRVVARVCWRRDGEHLRGVGVQFDRFLRPQESRHLLERLADGRSAGKDEAE